MSLINSNVPTSLYLHVVSELIISIPLNVDEELELEEWFGLPKMDSTSVKLIPTFIFSYLGVHAIIAVQAINSTIFFIAILLN